MGEFAIKVSPFDGSTAGRRGAVEYGLAEGGVQTTTCSGCKPIVKWVQTNSGTGAYHYLFVVQTYSGSRVDLYRSLYLPAVGAVAQAAEAVASLCGRTCAFSRHCFW